MICYLDLDGVLVDLYGHAHEPHGLTPVDSWPAGEYNIAKTYGFCDSDFWPTMDQAPFWAHLPWLPDGKIILKLCEDTFEEVCLVSHPCGPSCAEGKIRWIQRELPRYYRNNDYMIGPGRRYLGHPGAALVDDGDANIINFIGRGGKGILMPRRWNTGHYVSDPLRALEMRFNSYLEAVNEEETRRVQAYWSDRRKRYKGLVQETQQPEK